MSLRIDGKLVGGGGSGSGGHTILDDSGTALAQEDNLQFTGVYSEDDSTNSATKVNVYREMTRAEFDLLSDEEKAGFIRVTDEADIVSIVDGVFIDANDVIKNDFTFDGTGHTWTATEDCIIAGNLVAVDSYTGAYIWVDNITCFNCYEATSGNGFNIPVKKGQVVTYRAKTGATNNKMTAYGVQTGSKVIKNNYSTSEQVIGTWIDGKTLYEKTIDCGAFPNTDTKNVAHNIANVDKIWVFDGFVYDSNGNSYQLNRTTNDFNYQWETRVNRTNVSIQDFANFGNDFSAFVVVRYTKSS